MRFPRLLPPVSALVLCLARVAGADPTLTTLATFDGTTGADPQAGVFVDAAGNLYGTTSAGGTDGYGTAFELSGTGQRTLTTLVSFGYTNGANPAAGFTADAAGNLFGTTSAGGSGSRGTAFELSGPDHQTLTTLASFAGPNGSTPQAGLTADAAGNLYGTTQAGGTNGQGTAFELSGSTHQTVTTLANLAYATGDLPYGGLTADAAGNLYGTTYSGGATGGGTAFELSGADHQTFTTLVSFASPSGSAPLAGFTADPQGNLYGTTSDGGVGGAGTIFELSGVGHQTLTTLLAFDGADGANPYAGLTIDAVGNLYGTTEDGGADGDGTVFELSGADHQTLTTLANFDDTTGTDPYGGLVADAAGNLYGTTTRGGGGTVYELTGTAFQVPEPSALSALALGSFALLRPRRASRRVARVGSDRRR